MTPPSTPERDPIQDLLENTHISVDDVKTNVETSAESQVQETEVELDLDQVKETTQAQQEIKEELSIFSLITRTELLIENFKRIEKEAKKLNSNKEKNWEEWIQKAQARTQIKELEDILNILKRYKKKWDSLWKDSLDRYDQELRNKDNILKQFEEQRDRIVLNQTWWSTAYEIKVNTLKDALKLTNNIDKIRKSLTAIDEELRKTELKNEMRQELLWLKIYLLSAINNPNSPLAPFELKHREDIQKLNVIDPSLYYLIEKNVNPSPQVTTQNPSIDPMLISNNKLSSIPWCPNWILVPTYEASDRKQTFEQWWIKWLLRKALNYTKMTNWQKDSWTNGLFLVWIWAAIWQWWKWLFKKKKEWEMGFWWKAAIIWWAFFWANALTWKSLPEWIKGVTTWWLSLDWLKTDWKKTDIQQTQEMETYVQIPVMTSLLLWNTKISDLDNKVDKDFKLKNYDELLMSYKNSSLATYQAIGKELEKMWKDDKEWKIKNWLANIWITPENYKNLDQNKTVLDYFKIYASNTTIFENYTKDKKLVLASWKETHRDALIRSWKAITNDEMKKLEDEWILVAESVEWPIDNEVFDPIKDDKLDLKTQVENFNIDKIAKDRLIKYWNLLYIGIPWWSQKIPEFKEAGGFIYLKNYWEWTKIDVNNKSLIWLSDNENNTIKFDSTMEMMKVANLTNYIKSLFRWRKTWTTADDYHPFKESSITDLIDFKLNWFWDLVYINPDQKDKTKPRYNPSKYNRSDVEVSDWWWFGDLKAISPILNKNIDRYAKYLNELDIRQDWKKTNWIPS